MDIRDPVLRGLHNDSIHQLNNGRLPRLRARLGAGNIRQMILIDGSDNFIKRLRRPITGIQYLLKALLRNQHRLDQVDLAHPAYLIDRDNVLGIEHPHCERIADFKDRDGIIFFGNLLRDKLNNLFVDDIIREVDIRQPRGLRVDTDDILRVDKT